MVEFAGPPGGLSRRRLSFQQPLISQNKSVLVTTEVSLIEQLGKWQANRQEYQEILIGANINLKRPIEIPSQLGGGGGICFKSAGGRLISQTSCFILKGQKIKFDSLLADCLTFAEGSGVTYSGVSIINCDLFCNRVFVDDPANVNTDVIIQGNFFRVAGPITQSVIQLHGVGVVNGNRFSQTASGVGNIVVGAGGRRVAITGNYVNNGGIVTNASAGNNTIVGNTVAGTITPAGSDQVGLNT